MRKIAYSIFAVLLTAGVAFTASAQTEETRDVSGFTRIGSGGSFTVHVKIDGTESLKISGKAETLSKIETRVEDGELEIKWKDNWKNHDEDHWGKVDVYVTAKSLTAAANAGSGDMTIDGTVAGEKVDISMAGSGSITSAVKATDLHASLSGSGAINLTGSADDAKVSVSGSGEFNSKELKTSAAHVNLAGSGNVYLIANNSISGHIAGSGNIVYSGNASEEDIKTAGSGRVHKE